jgi:hypothetical protein
MHLATASAAPAASLPKLGSHERYIGKPKLDNGVAWQTYEDTRTFLFGFAAATGFIGAGEHETAARADKEARRWCAAFVAEPVFEPVPALEVVGAEAFDAAVFGEPEACDISVEVEFVKPSDEPPALAHPVVCGWRIEVKPELRGGYYVDLYNEATGMPAPVRFTGYETAKGAMDAAGLWTLQHPCDGVNAVAIDDDGPVADGHFIHDDGAEPEGGGGLPDAADAIVCGWRVIVGNDASDDGAFMVECVAQENGVVVGGAGDFAGFNGSEEACDYGRKYAANNPAPGNTSTVVAGWVISTEQGPTRKFEAILIDGSTGKLGALAEDFSGYDTGDDAVEAGTTWAIANPTDAAVAEANELWSHVDAARRPALEADMSRAADRLDQDAADLRAELARVTRERDEARAAHARDTKACNAVAVDLAWNTKRKGELEARIADDKDELKGVVKRLKELETEVQETLEAVGKGKQVPLFPTVTIEGPKVSSPAVTSVTFTAGDRKKLDAALRDHDGRRPATLRRETTAVLTTTWHHAGVDYALESSELPGGQWRSCIHGHEVATEAFERSREEAETNCKAAAVVVFEKPAAVDDAVRMPAKRGRKPRAKAGAA